jgi:hypothetical protein
VSRNKIFLNTKSIFPISLIVIFLTILSVWLLGLGTHRTMIQNSLLSTVILSSVFFLFILVGLYKGFKLRDNLGAITNQFEWKKLEYLKDVNATDTDTPDVGDGIVGIILGVILWIIVSIIISFLLYIFGAILWMTVLIFIAMLY